MTRLHSMLVVAVALVLAVAGVAVASVEMDVPVYKQGYPSPWYSDQLGTCSETIGSAGCAITSIAMVFKYYGVQTDPGDMNNWLKQNDGYDSGCLVKWPVAAGRSEGTVQWAGRYDYTSIPADLNRINSELNNGYPVIAEVRLSGSQHFVVITGYSGSTYYINDPWYGDKSTINGRYGDPASAIYGIRLYHGTGTAADTPIPLSGDLNGDGTDSYGIFDPSTAGFTFSGKTVNFGASTDLPVMGDWDHDGKDEIGVYRPDDGGQSKFYLITRDWSSLSGPAGAADKTIPFGYYPDNIPIAGDWDGDDDDDIGGFYPGSNNFYLYILNLPSSNADPYTPHPSVSFGTAGDTPIIGDWDGDNDDDVGVFRPEATTNYFYLDLGLTGGQHEMGPYSLGNVGDEPLVGDWNGNGYDNLGVYRPVDGTFHPAPDLPPVPTLCTSPDPPSHNFGTMSEGQTRSWAFDVTNCGTGTLTWTASDDQSWIGVTPASGSTTTETDEVTVTIDTTGLSAGMHTGHVTIDAGAGGSRTGAITVTVDAAIVLTVITVSPTTASMTVSDTEVFMATAYDQFENVMPDIVITWMSTNTVVGTVNPASATTGADGTATTIFTAVTDGTTTVTATSGSVTGTASVTVCEGGLPKTGDIDGNGEVTMSDAVYLAKHVVGLSGYETLYHNEQSSTTNRRNII